MLAFTAQQMAVARGQTRVAGEIILCLGGVTVAVAVDADGQPTGKSTGQQQICPDCALHFIAALDLPDLHLALPVLGAVQYDPLGAINAPRAVSSDTHARGPPLFV